MQDLKKVIFEYIQTVDGILKFNSFSGKNLIDWFRPLVNSMLDNGAIPYLLEKNGRFRASPLASTIIGLNDAGLLPVYALECLQSKLLDLRDNNEVSDTCQGNTKKFEEDKLGWSLAEGVSVWSTSLAIIALLDAQGIGIKRASEFKESVLWLVKQQKIESNGWAYQCCENCTDNVIMTSLAMRALSLAQRHKGEFIFNYDEERSIISALKSGFSYLKQKMTFDKVKKYAYWSFEEKPHCAATIWALLALRDMSELSGIGDEVRSLFDENVKRGIEFVLSRIPKGVTLWDNEQIVCEGGAKYNKQKNYYSFSATLLSPLLDLGVSPYHPKITGQIAWLIKNPEEWKIRRYDTADICAFTYATVIGTLAKWVMAIGHENSTFLLGEPNTKSDKIRKLIGVPKQNFSSVMVIQKNRLWHFMLCLLMFFFIFVCGKRSYFIVRSFVNKLFVFIDKSIDSIIINVLSAAIYAIIVAVLIYAVKKVRSLIRRLKN